MGQARIGTNKVVSVTYTILDESNEIIEKIDIPVSYLHGRDSGLFPKIEQALEGKQVGDEVEVELSPAEGFGERDPSKTFTDVIENVPPQYRQLGAEAEFVNEQGESLKMVVTHVDAGTVTLDGNHPFAGKAVRFVVNVADVRDATAQEISSGDVSQYPGGLH